MPIMTTTKITMKKPIPKSCKLCTFKGVITPNVRICGNIIMLTPAMTNAKPP